MRSDEAAGGAARVEGLFTAPHAGAPMEQQGMVVLVPGVGIVGDRYALGIGHWSDPRWPDQELTLFEAEVAGAAGFAPELARRNVVTRGVVLSGLAGMRFRVGEAVLEGVRACSPCGYVERTSGVRGMSSALAGWNGGLRARVVAGGRVRLGDAVEVLGLVEGPG